MISRSLSLVAESGLILPHLHTLCTHTQTSSCLGKLNRNCQKYRDVIENVYLDHDLSVSATRDDKHLNIDCRA